MAKKGIGPWEEEPGHTSVPHSNALNRTLWIACSPQHGAVLFLLLPGTAQFVQPASCHPCFLRKDLVFTPVISLVL